MNEYKKEDIKNLHFNHHNEIQFEYGGQIHHHSMDSLKEMFIGCWNLQQENKQLKEEKEELKKWLEEEHKRNISWYGSLTHHDKQYYLYKFGTTKDVLDNVQDKIKELEEGINGNKGTN